MTTIEKDKDTSDHILEKAKQEYWDYKYCIVHPSKKSGHIVTQEEWERRQKEARKKHKENPLLYYSDKIHGWVPDYEKSLQDMQDDYDDCECKDKR